MTLNLIKKNKHIFLFSVIGFCIFYAFFSFNTNTAPVINTPLFSNNTKYSNHLNSPYLNLALQHGHNISILFLLKGFKNINLPPIQCFDSLHNTNNTTSKYISTSSNKYIIFEKELAPLIKIQRKYTLDNHYTLTETVSISNFSNKNEEIKLNWIYAPFNINTNDASSSASLIINDKTEKLPNIKDLKSLTFSGIFSCIEFHLRYFLIKFIQKNHSATISHEINPINVLYNNRIIPACSYVKIIAIPSNEVISFASDIYIGPKTYLLNNVNFSKFDYINKPLSSLFLLISQWTLNSGISIILLTVLIKFLTSPLTRSSIKSQQHISSLSSSLKDIQQKYASNKELLRSEQIKLYQKEKVNPLSGCFPVLIQMPIWISLYYILNNSIELYKQPLGFWIHDLTAPDPFFILPFCIFISTIITQYTAITPPPQNNIFLFWIFPMLVSIFMSSLPSGLTLHILINNILSIHQQIRSKTSS
ncbi:MAG: membrane protein insertase YidC [Deltaproteobacteria bacterium]|nr:MAG: membrane protein insertase YidC [Deltaproteobacteria bacterium]